MEKTDLAFDETAFMPLRSPVEVNDNSVTAEVFMGTSYRASSARYESVKAAEGEERAKSLTQGADEFFLHVSDNGDMRMTDMVFIPRFNSEVTIDYDYPLSAEEKEMLKSAYDKTIGLPTDIRFENKLLDREFEWEEPFFALQLADLTDGDYLKYAQRTDMIRDYEVDNAEDFRLLISENEIAPAVYVLLREDDVKVIFDAGDAEIETDWSGYEVPVTTGEKEAIKEAYEREYGALDKRLPHESERE